MRIVNKNRLLIPLYHGTSTLFLDSIVTHGLGGANPIRDWSVLELAKDVLVLSQKNLRESATFSARHNSFRKMILQEAGTMNWQHGDAYLSPAMATAIGYAANKRLGSELLTYTLDLLEELIQHDVPGVKDNLFRKYPQVFNVLDLSCSPILIEANEVPIPALAGEDGGDALVNLKRIEDAMQNDPDIAHVIIQQDNFRLRESIPIDALRFWLINVLRWDSFCPEFKLYEIKVV